MFEQSTYEENVDTMVPHQTCSKSYHDCQMGELQGLKLDQPLPQSCSSHESLVGIDEAYTIFQQCDLLVHNENIQFCPFQGIEVAQHYLLQITVHLTQNQCVNQWVNLIKLGYIHYPTQKLMQYSPLLVDQQAKAKFMFPFVFHHFRLKRKPY